MVDDTLEYAGLFTKLPTRFGRYEVQQVLGKGGMGAVYLAQDTQLDRLVALKVPQFGSEDRTDRVERFLRETRAAAAVWHPNLCPVFDVGLIDDVPYYTMPCIEGTPLSKRLQTGPGLEISEAARVAREIALAMHAAHQRGILHRDLKPANVILTRQDQPVVLDFGLVRSLFGNVSQRLTMSGAILGTPTYMSPEQASGAAQGLNPASDIYSLGVILYEMLTGQPPFRAEGIGPLLAQIERDAPPPPRQQRAEIPPALEVLCLKALAKRPADRFTSMMEFATALTPHTAAFIPAALFSSTAQWSPPVPQAALAQTSFATTSSWLAAWDGRRLLTGLTWLFLVGGIVLIIMGMNSGHDYDAMGHYVDKGESTRAVGKVCLFVTGICMVIRFGLKPLKRVDVSPVPTGGASSGKSP